MNKVWFVEKKIGSDVDYFLAAESEFKGLQHALVEIVTEIGESAGYWDMSNSETALKAKEIYDKAHSLRIEDLRSAINLYNSFYYDNCGSNSAHKWEVFATYVQEPEAIMKLDDSFFGLEEDEDDEELTEEEIKKDVQVAASCTGATCRKCHAYNEYAAPDTSDGTYHCSQCKTFTQVFGQIN